MNTPNLAQQTKIRLKVLAVDDNEHNLHICTEILRDDYEVITAKNGEEAIAKSLSAHPDVILMDVMMPGMDGLEASARIKSRPETRHIPIIILSAKGMSEDVIAGLTVAEDYIVKPFNIMEVRARVKSMARLKMALDEVNSVNSRLEELVQKGARQLLEKERLAMVGQYAAGIVHNLSGALQKVVTSLELAEMEGMDTKKYLATAREGTESMRDIVSTILDKGRNEQRLDRTHVDINEVISTAIKFWDANPKFKHSIAKTIRLEPNLPKIFSVYAHWSQSINNLLGNAIEAMEKSEQRALTVSSNYVSGLIRIQISDSGHGIPKELQEKIFEPFFSTKPESQGTGLGLASVKALLEPYGATIELTSKVDSGTTFTLTIPVDELFVSHGQ